MASALSAKVCPDCPSAKRFAMVTRRVAVDAQRQGHRSSDTIFDGTDSERGLQFGTNDQVRKGNVLVDRSEASRGDEPAVLEKALRSFKSLPDGLLPLMVSTDC